MRTVTSLFGRKKGHSQPTEDVVQPSLRAGSKKVFGSMSRKISFRNQSTPQLVPSDFGDASTASSSGSSHPKTPDEQEASSSNSSRKRWTWRSVKKAPEASGPNVPTELWDLSRTTNLESNSKLQSLNLPLKPTRMSYSSDEDEDQASQSEDDEAGESVTLRPIDTPISLEIATSRLTMLTEDGLRPPFAPSPLLHLPGSPLYPRSVNIPGALYCVPTLETNMMRRRLLDAIGTGDFPTMQEGSSSYFAPQLTNRFLPRPSLFMDDIAVKPPVQVSSNSPGLACWRSRGYFEERVSVWMQSDAGDLISSIVVGSRFAVEALDVSPHLEAMAGNGEILSAQSTTLTTMASNNTIVASPISRNAPTLPSPLRNQHNHSSPPSLPIMDMTLSNSGFEDTFSSLLSPPLVATTPKPVPLKLSRGVRFAEEEGSPPNVSRNQRQRAERAQTLQEERDRKAFDALRAAQQAERKKREQERMEWEREKAAWEQERKAMEEERRKKAYTKEVTAARARREASRTGSLGRPGMRETISARSYHDSGFERRQASDPTVPTMRHASSYSPGSSGSPSPADMSPINSDDRSRPNSIASARTSVSSLSELHGLTESAKRRSSLPPQARHNQSLFSQLPPPLPQFPMAPMMPMMPMTPYNAFSMQIPAIPYNPYDMVMMPLLPPTPAFMMQQSRPASSARKSSSLPRPSGSSEKLVSPPTSSGATERPQRERRDSYTSSRPNNNSSSDVRIGPPDRRSDSSGDLHAWSGNRLSGSSMDSLPRTAGDRRSGKYPEPNSRPLTDRRSGSSGDIPTRNSVPSVAWPFAQPKPTYLTPWEVQSQLLQQKQKQQQHQQSISRGRPRPSVVT